ncbi:MAG: hypothetical protein ACRDQU_13095 [Pseudonocardiaceae bacterium]
MNRAELPPAPLEWHPFYRDHTWLIDWLNGDPAYPNISMRLPICRPVGLWNLSQDPSVLTDNTLLLTKDKAWGLAPYVGPPFVYMWYIAADQFGRAIAGESRIVYIDPLTCEPTSFDNIEGF